MDQDKYRALIDGHVRDAEARGEFDDLPGSGKPLASDAAPYDENWWVKGLIARENLDMTAALPPSLAVRKELQGLPRTLAAMPFEAQVREHLAGLNGRIREARLNTVGGPPVVLRDVDVDEVVGRWRAARIVMKRAADAEASEAGTGEGRTSKTASGRRWWRR
jgi:Domain of unknown function (DUF1992)